MTQPIRALLILALVPMLWGLTFPLIKMSSAYMSAENFVTLRCLLSALVLLPFVISRLLKLPQKRILQGLVLGILNGANLLCQTKGLRTLDPASSAFITGIATVIVPFLTPLFGLSKPKLIHYMAALMALIGLFILTNTSLKQNLAGITWTLACALFYSLFIVYLQKVKPVKSEVFVLSFYQIVGSCILASLLGIHHFSGITLNLTTLSTLLFCGIMVTSLVAILQTRYQQFVPTTQVTLLYSLEALFASIFSYFLLREPLTLHLFLGGGLMMASIFLVIPKKRENII